MAPALPVEKKFLKKMFKKIIEFFLAYNIPRPPMSVNKNFQPIRSAVCPTIDNIYIYTNVFFYYIDKKPIL